MLIMRKVLIMSALIMSLLIRSVLIMSVPIMSVLIMSGHSISISVLIKDFDFQAILQPANK